MDIKLIVAMVSDEKRQHIIDAAREEGATGATVITSVRGEGMSPGKSFLGLDLTAQKDVILFLVAGTRSREILETICEAGNFDEDPGAGVAFVVGIEDVVGLQTQLPTILNEIEGEV